MNCLSRSALVILVGLTTLLCTACGEAQNQRPQSTAAWSYTTAYQTVAASACRTTSTVTAAEDVNVTLDSAAFGSFRPGIWLAKDKDTEEERFFIFTDETHGRLISQQNGQETPFTCEASEIETVFQLGAEEGRKVGMLWTDADHAVIQWNEEKVEFISFLRDNGTEPFHFFTNEQLCAMALDYYTARTGTRPSHARTLYNVDETIAVQLYDGDGNAQDTYDWYTVDRYTGEGYNTHNETIRLGEAPAEAVPAQTTAVSGATAQTTPAPQQTTAPPATTVAPQTTVPQTTAPETEPARAAEEQPAETVPSEPLPSETIDELIP